MFLMYDVNGERNWPPKVKHVLSELGFGFVWQKFVRNVDCFERI